MSDDHTKSLHEELLAAFMASAETPAEIAAVNEINELRKKLAGQATEQVDPEAKKGWLK